MEARPLCGADLLMEDPETSLGPRRPNQKAGAVVLTPKTRGTTPRGGDVLDNSSLNGRHFVAHVKTRGGFGPPALLTTSHESETVVGSTTSRTYKAFVTRATTQKSGRANPTATNNSKGRKGVKHRTTV